MLVIAKKNCNYRKGGYIPPFSYNINWLPAYRIISRDCIQKQLISKT